MATNLSAGQVTIDYIAKDFNSVVDDLINFATANFGPGTPSNRLWTDFNADSFSRTWLELVAYVSDLLFFYLDNQATEAYLESATLQSSILNIANQFGYVISTAQSSGGIANFTTIGPANIPSGFRVADTSGNPYFTTQPGSIGNAGVLSISTIQGKQVVDNFTAQGLQSEELTLSQTNLVVDSTNIIPTLRSPIVTVNSVTWTQVNTFIESFPNSQVYQVLLNSNSNPVIKFGDSIFGKQLNAGDQVSVSYRVGGGTLGNIGSNLLTTLTDSAVNVTSVTNNDNFSGGTDAPTLDQLKQLIPASLSTLERAVTAQDYADIITLNFPQIAQVSASTQNTQTGIDLNIYMVPVGTTVTEITQNPNLLNSIGNFLNLHKMVTSQFSIQNGTNVALLIGLTVYVNQNASRALVLSNIQSALANYFNFSTGTISASGTGPTFAQEVLLANVYNILDAITGIDRYDITELSYVPNVLPRVNNVNQLQFASVEGMSNSGRYEYFIATEVVPPNLSGSAIGQYEVFQRQYLTVTNISDNSISDNTANFSVLNSSGTLVSTDVILDNNGNIFTNNQWVSGYLLVDSNGSIFKIVSNNANSITIDPIPINPSGSAFVNGSYNIVTDLRDISAGGPNQSSLILNGHIVSILYNNVNTIFVIPGAELLVLGTLADPFIVSTKLTLPLVRTNITSNSAFPTIQLSPVLLSSLTFGQGVLSFPSGEYTNFNPLTGVVSVKDVVNLSSVVPGDNFLDSNDVIWPILSGVNNTLGSKSFTIKTGTLQVGVFTPSGYNSIPGFLSVPDAVDLSGVVAGDIFIDAGARQYEILGGINNTPGSKGFDIQAGLGLGVVNLTIGATIYSGVGQASGSITGFGSINQIQPGWLLEDVNGTVALINSVNYAANQVTLDINSDLVVTGLAEASDSNRLPIPIINTSINTTSLPNVFQLGTPLTGANAKIVPGDLLVDNTGVANEILQVPYVTYTNANATTYTYTDTNLAVEVFTNSGPVSYTYSSPTGVIQYASSVDLTAVDSGDQFKDGSGTYFTIFQIDYINNQVIIQSGQTVNTASGGNIFSGTERGLIQYTSPISWGIVAVLDRFRDSNGVDYIIDTFSTSQNIVRISTNPSSIGLAPSNLGGGSIRSFSKVELAPGFTTPEIGTGGTLTRRFYGPNNTVTWVVSYNGSLANVGYLNVNEVGLDANSNPADQFTIRTSPKIGDITNLRDNEIPTLSQSNENINLFGGNP
jgi:Baseplate J-like protein